jgi:hypothetical protein
VARRRPSMTSSCSWTATARHVMVRFRQSE